MDVGKREDRLLDQISALIHNRNAALDWIKTYQETGVLEKETAEWLELTLRGE
jgi:hypothetical protein